MAEAVTLTAAEEAELQALAAWFASAPLPFGPYVVNKAVTVDANMAAHAFIRSQLARNVRGQQRRALYARLRRLRQLFGEPQPPTVDPDDATRVDPLQWTPPPPPPKPQPPPRPPRPPPRRFTVG